MKRSKAQNFVNSLINMRKGAEDSLASTSIDIYPSLKETSVLISAGTRINHNGILKRAAVDLWDTEENNPDNAPTLWEDIDYKEGYRIIPETITVGTAFAKDEYGLWNDKLYISSIDANVYTPDQYPDGWQVID